MHLIAAGCLQCEVQRVGYVFSPHVGAELPRDDVAAVIVEYRAEIEPAPANHLDVGEVCLPKLVDLSRLVFELTGCLDDDEGRAGDQIMGLQRAIHCGFRHKVAFLIRERHGQLARRQLRLFQGEVDNLALHLVRNTVPDVLWLGRLILQPSLTALQIPVVPAIERGAGNAQLGQRQACRQMALLDQPDDLQASQMLGTSFVVAPIACHAFFEKTQFERLLGNHLLEVLCFAAQFLDLVSVRSARRVTRQPLLPGFHEVL